MMSAMRRDLPTGTVTFLFSDVQGSTKLLRELGPEEYGRLLMEHRAVIRAAFAANGGVEVDTQGDAFFVAFASAMGAVAAAGAVRDKLAGGPIRVRIGLHSGTPHLTEEGYVGEDVHLGARIASAGHGGQVLLSAATRSSVDGEITELGEHRLKDFAQAIPIFQLGDERFPPLKTISNTNLPRPASSFVGREHEVARIVSLVRGGARLVTLAGPGGTGKTRLAIEAGAELVGEFKAGVFWVDLSPIRDPALVTETISKVLGAKDGLAAHIAEREMLLLLDNLEQVVDAASDLGHLLEACPNLHLLVTSRTLLRLRGEVEYPVQPLAEREGVELFCVRANVRADATVAEICRRLDHLPLAIELAAARAKVLSPAQIAERLAERLPLLTSGARDLPERQRTLSATIAWSYHLLSANERRLFKQLSVFVGGCTLEAAEEVCDADVDGLASLIDKSLLRRENERYVMLETIREYALDELRLSGEAGDVRQRHASFYSRLAEIAEPALLGPQGAPISSGGGLRGASQAQWLDQLGPEHDNLRSTLARCIERSDSGSAVRVVLGASPFWQLRGHFREGRKWTEDVLSIEGVTSHPRYGFLLTVSADFPHRQGDLGRARALAEQGLERLRQSGEPWEVAYGLHCLGAIVAEQGGYEQAKALLEQGLAIRRDLGDAGGISHALNGLCTLAFQEHDYVSMERFALEEVQTARDSPDLGVSSLHDLGEALKWQEKLPSATQYFVEALRLSAQLRSPYAVGECLDALADVSAMIGAHTEAAHLWAKSDELFREAEAVSWDPRDAQLRVDATRAVLGLDAFEEAWRAGGSMTLEQAITLATAMADRVVQTSPEEGHEAVAPTDRK
jgi:predicted ATPase/class 3 adenylate cyclase